MALDEEIAINTTQTEHDQICQRLVAEFDLDEADERDLAKRFLSRCPT